VDTLGAVVDRDVSWVRRRRAALVSRGLMRVVLADEVSPAELGERELLELTRAGLEVVAAHLGLSVGVAVRQHGLAGGAPDHPVGARAALLGHLDHTLGADAFMASLGRAAAGHPAGGALVEWRAAAVCAHGRCRPDGYGVLRLKHQQHGFFLEFDRGTMREDRLRAKFIGYHRYRASGHASRSFAGFPLLLIVTLDPGAEQRLARALRAADVEQGQPLSALLTTTSLLELSQCGPLGAVWRTAANTARCRVWD
jgi:Replication-relaxation